MRFIGLLLGLLALSGEASAESFGIIGNDERVPIRGLDPPWQAVGQINASGWRFRSICTGTLIAPRIVVTAAHCLVTPWDRKPVPSQNIHFVAGVHGERMVGHSVAACVRLAPGALSLATNHNPDVLVQPVPLQAFLDDIAVIVLKDDLPVTPVPPASVGTFVAGADLMHGAYPAHRRYQLMADTRCRTLSAQRDLWFTDCDTYPASSGGPVFIRERGSWRVGAVMVGFHDGQASLAWPLSQWRGLSLEPACPPP